MRRNGPDQGLPLRGDGRAGRRAILASHLILTGYGHWLPNDPRGSGSDSVRKDELAELGAIHRGRKRKQPSREELKAFYANAKPVLEHATIWFDAEMRCAIGDGFAEAVRRQGYTVYACAVCSNHAHLVVRTHRNRAETIWDHFAAASQTMLHDRKLVETSHPVWSHRPYKVFLYSSDEIRGRLEYVWRNPLKESLTPQDWGFVRKYLVGLSSDRPRRASADEG